MSKETKALRAAIKHLPRAWVRVYDDGTIWAGRLGEFVNWSVGGERMLEVKRALESAGYICELNGTPGTSGAHTITVRMP